jgi:5-methylcytosine-specific restriction endonuclease McrA
VNTLQLNADYTPMKILRWEHAIELVLAGKAVTVTAFPGRFVRSQSLALPWPAVIALRRYALPRARARFSARNVKARDGFMCAYCGIRPRHPDGRPDRRALTLDHVIPRAQARDGSVYLPWSRRWVSVTCWENVTAACRACNTRKADRSPTQAGMPIRVYPRIPGGVDVLRITLGSLGAVPVEWEVWLPERWREGGPHAVREAG